MESVRFAEAEPVAVELLASCLASVESWSFVQPMAPDGIVSDLELALIGGLSGERRPLRSAPTRDGDAVRCGYVSGGCIIRQYGEWSDGKFRPGLSRFLSRVAGRDAWLHVEHCRDGVTRLAGVVTPTYRDGPLRRHVHEHSGSFMVKEFERDDSGRAVRVVSGEFAREVRLDGFDRDIDGTVTAPRYREDVLPFGPHSEREYTLIWDGGVVDRVDARAPGDRPVLAYLRDLRSRVAPAAELLPRCLTEAFERVLQAREWTADETLVVIVDRWASAALPPAVAVSPSTGGDDLLVGELEDLDLERHLSQDGLDACMIINQAWQNTPKRGRDLVTEAFKDARAGAGPRDALLVTDLELPLGRAERLGHGS